MEKGLTPGYGIAAHSDSFIRSNEIATAKFGIGQADQLISITALLNPVSQKHGPCVLSQRLTFYVDNWFCRPAYRAATLYMKTEPDSFKIKRLTKRSSTRIHL